MNNHTASETITTNRAEGPIKAPTALLKRWLRAYTTYNLSTNTVLTSAIWIIYLTAHGYSPLAIGLFEMTFHIAKFVTEVPTGIFADLLGRRKSLIVYCILSAIEALLFLIPTTPFIILSFTISGIAIAFRGGADEAILWTLAGQMHEKDHSKAYSKLVSWMMLVSLAASVIGTASGGYLSNIVPVLPFLCRAGLVLFAIIPLLMLPEQRAGDGKQGSKQHPWRHLKAGLKAVWQSLALLALLLISGLTDSCWQTIYFYYQLYLHDQGFSLSTIGIIVAISIGSNFVFTAVAPWMMRHLSERLLVLAFVLCQIVGLALMSWE